MQSYGPHSSLRTGLFLILKNFYYLFLFTLNFPREAPEQPCRLQNAFLLLGMQTRLAIVLYSDSTDSKQRDCQSLNVLLGDCHCNTLERLQFMHRLVRTSKLIGLHYNAFVLDNCWNMGLFFTVTFILLYTPTFMHSTNHTFVLALFGLISTPLNMSQLPLWFIGRDPRQSLEYCVPQALFSFTWSSLWGKLKPYYCSCNINGSAINLKLNAEISCSPFILAIKHLVTMISDDF